MATVLCVGLATLDFVFRLDALPDRPRKYQAETARMVGGGGAANAAVAIARLGGAAILSARIGDDPVGALILADLAAEGVDTRHVRPRPDTGSAWSSVCIDAAGERQIVNYRGSGPTPEIGWVDTHSELDAVLADTRAPEAARAALNAARARGLPGVLDGEAPVAPDLLDAASHVAFSMQGLSALMPECPLDEALATLASRHAIWAAVTDGAGGTWFTAPDGIAHAPAFPVEAVDTLGAGDVWHGAFALALAEGQDEAAAVRFASAAAALKCTQPGGRAGAPDRAAVLRFLEARPTP
ncbi:MAG: sugar kinase [Maritimibacter sp.]|nr:sugar kinase [Maritimibacter sp.]